MSLRGHLEEREMLGQALEGGRLHHAYLFTGGEGIGKRRVAYELIARVFCQEEMGRPCGSCRTCQRVLSIPDWYDERQPFEGKGNEPPLCPIHPDVLTLVPHGQFIKVDQIREVLRQVPFQPVEAPYRFVLIDDAHKMNVEAANALLKTLEEPPPKTRFILLSSQSDKLLVTIRSRCEPFPFRRLQDATLREILEERGLDLSAYPSLLKLSEGSVKKALLLTEDESFLLWDDILDEILAVALSAHPDPRGLHLLAKKLGDLRDSQLFFSRLELLLRDLLLLRSGGAFNGQALFHEEKLDKLMKWAKKLSIEGIIGRIRLLEESARNVMIYHISKDLAFERALYYVLGQGDMVLPRLTRLERKVL